MMILKNILRMTWFIFLFEISSIMALIILFIRIINDHSKENKKTKEELSELDDESLCEHIWIRLIDNMGCRPNSLLLLSKREREVYIVLEYKSEMENGGICQYLQNSIGERNDLLEDSLNDIGAINNQKLFHDFISNNHIDYMELQEVDSKAAYNTIYQKYPFDQYDDNYISLQNKESIISLCAHYIRDYCNYLVSQEKVAITSH